MARSRAAAPCAPPRSTDPSTAVSVRSASAASAAAMKICIRPEYGGKSPRAQSGTISRSRAERIAGTSVSRSGCIRIGLDAAKCPAAVPAIPGAPAVLVGLPPPQEMELPRAFANRFLDGMSDQDRARALIFVSGIESVQVRECAAGVHEAVIDAGGTAADLECVEPCQPRLQQPQNGIAMKPAYPRVSQHTGGAPTFPAHPMQPDQLRNQARRPIRPGFDD